MLKSILEQDNVQFAGVNAVLFNRWCYTAMLLVAPCVNTCLCEEMQLLQWAADSDDSEGSKKSISPLKLLPFSGRRQVLQPKQKHWSKERPLNVLMYFFISYRQLWGSNSDLLLQL